MRIFFSRHPPPLILRYTVGASALVEHDASEELAVSGDLLAFESSPIADSDEYDDDHDDDDDDDHDDDDHAHDFHRASQAVTTATAAAPSATAKTVAVNTAAPTVATVRPSAPASRSVAPTATAKPSTAKPSTAKPSTAKPSTAAPTVAPTAVPVLGLSQDLAPLGVLAGEARAAALAAQAAVNKADKDEVCVCSLMLIYLIYCYFHHCYLLL